MASDEALAEISVSVGSQRMMRHREAKHGYYALADHYMVRLLRDVLDHAAEENISLLDSEGEIS
ncbi:hypothetical protein ABLO27_00295 [Roseibium sp. SCPC15]|uniref:hypothetical protein n=1 Tax=Roseibium sp. SCP15 TaxID=3141376 RepID=UPI003337952B